jgi:hypothetical protein
LVSGRRRQLLKNLADRSCTSCVGTAF